MQSITILGATGSIGGSTLNILARHPDKYKLFAVSAHTDVQALLAICREWQPQFAVMVEERAAEELATLIQQAGLDTQVLAGEAGLVSIAEHPDCHTVVAAVVGAAGLLPTLAAARAGKDCVWPIKRP